MPDPIRTGLVIPPALLADEPSAGADGVRAERAEVCTNSSETQTTTAETPVPGSLSDRPGVAIGVALKWDPFGRDGSRRPEVKGEWLPETLAKYLKDVQAQIDSNLTSGRLPTTEQLDRFVGKLVSNSHRYLKAAPKKVRHRLHALFALRFQRFWNFTRNEKVRTVNAQEVKLAVLGLVESLLGPDFTSASAEQQLLVQPKPLRHYSCGQMLRPSHCE